jgi:hypothetical protein
MTTMVSKPNSNRNNSTHSGGLDRKKSDRSGDSTGVETTQRGTRPENA